MSDPNAITPGVLAAALALAVYSLAVLWGYAPVRYERTGGKRVPVYISGWRAVLKRASFLLAAIALGVLFVRWAMEPGDWPAGVIAGLAVIEFGPSVIAAGRRMLGRVGAGPS